ncbi:hypothetical protein [Sinorhizobium americanum]|uniref:Uncharacterized protein n=1 Tax=Sinorhizobium americanum TaxID=194963 RepID=A0A4R2BU12_9HYPH|nr:hypothetical protein [Sinorhizobium americanum]TCN30313.1 hypothetical protein EV184_108187 [Sinorhizobium americanum]
MTASLVPYAGARRPATCKPPRDPVGIPTVEGPAIGVSGIAFLRRVKAAAPDGYRVCRLSDRKIYDRVLAAGYIVTVPRHLGTVRLTPAGAAFLDRLMRVE